MKNIQNSFDLFIDDAIQKDHKKTPFLHVIHNEKVVEGYDYQTIFDNHRYDEIIGTSYSVGHSMIKNVINNLVLLQS